MNTDNDIFASDFYNPNAPGTPGTPDSQRANNARRSPTPMPSGVVLAWLRGRNSRSSVTTPKTLLVDPRRTDDAVTLSRWGCEVTAMFSKRDAATELREQLAAEGVDCISGDYFDLKTSWKNSVDLIILDCDETPPPQLLRATAIRLFANCLAESGRLIIISHEEAAMEQCVRTAAPLLMMLSSESSFDPYDGHEHEIIVAERTGVRVTNPKLPSGLIRKFPI